MKRGFTSLLALGFLSALSIVGSASAQEAATTTNATASVPTTSLTALIEARYAINDTKTKQRPFFFSRTARFGGQINYGRVNGKLLLQFNGNNSTGSLSNASSGATDTGVAGIREAWVSYDLLNAGGQTLTAQLGRFIPNGAKVYAADATSNWGGVGNFDPTDGLAFNYNFAQGPLMLGLQGAVANALPVTAYIRNDLNTYGGSLVGSADSVYSGTSNNNAMAYILNVAPTFKIDDNQSIEAAFTYASRAKAAAYTDNVLTGATDATLVYRGDMHYTEASLGYRYKAIAAGVWMSQVKLSNLISYVPSASLDTDANGNPLTFSNVSDVSNKFSVYGVGAQGDSTIWGGSNYFAKGDSFTYGVGFQKFSRRGSSTYDKAGNDVSQLGLGLGYKVGVFDASLNATFDTAKEKVFYKASSSTSADYSTKSANKIYLKTAIAI